MGQIDAIRRKVLREGKGIREVARETGASRNTVRKYVRGDSEPVRQESAPRARPVRGAIKPVIEEILEEWAGRTTAKQRVTGTRLLRELRERGHQVGITSVRDVLRERARQRMESYVPLVYRPGEVAQVDFFEVTVDVGGVRQKAWKFVMRLMYSGRDFVWVYDRQDQVAFLDAHVRAFAFFGAVPRRIVYDNLKAAVKKVLFPKRELAPRFAALQRHYQFEACFARPGEGHDKGGVESRGKTIRLQHLTPIPRSESLRELAEALLQAVCEQQQGKAAAFSEELAAMIALSSAPFDPRKAVVATVSRDCRVTAERGVYSVPSAWKCLPVTVHVGVDEVELVCRDERVTRPRASVGGQVVRYTDYLPDLARKPQALRQVAPELLEELGGPYGRLWALLTASHGEREGSRTLAKVLAAVTDHGEEQVRSALEAALAAPRSSGLAAATAGPERPRGPVTVPPALQGYEVESGSAADYDQLLVSSA